MDYQDDIRRLIAELGDADERRKQGLPPRNFTEANAYWELIILHRILDGITFILVEDDIDMPDVFEIPDHVPTEWLEEK